MLLSLGALAALTTAFAGVGCIGDGNDCTANGTCAAPGADATPGTADGSATTPDGSSATDGATKEDAPTTPPVDAGADVDAAPLPPPCNLQLPFGAPVPLAAANSAAGEYSPRETSDGLTVYFTRFELVGAANQFRVFAMQRPTLTAPFGALTLFENGIFDGVDTHDLSFHLSPDRLEVVFQRGTIASSAYDIYYASRTSAVGQWSVPVQVNAVSTGAQDLAPFFHKPTGKVYVTTGTNTISTRDIFEASLIGGTASGYRKLPVNMDGVIDQDAVVSLDGLTLYFSSTRGGGEPDIWYATRASTTAEFANPTAMTALNSAAFDSPSSISDDGCRLYLYSNRAGAADYDVYIASRPTN